MDAPTEVFVVITKEGIDFCSEFFDICHDYIQAGLLSDYDYYEGAVVRGYTLTPEL